ncbi:hypothetical protein BD309DRAFT_498022 [Dichomitus squalens]|nr:hypothetical protein BD309DRAFT_498022 [Dichomitus squalens]
MGGCCLRTAGSKHPPNLVASGPLSSFALPRRYPRSPRRPRLNLVPFVRRSFVGAARRVPHRSIAHPRLPHRVIVAFSVKTFSRQSMAGRGCFNCGGFGHQAANCPKAGTPTWSATIHLPSVQEILTSVVVTTVASKATSPRTARRRRRQRPVTNAGRRATSRVNARTTKTPTAALAEAAATPLSAAATRAAPSATAAVRWATSPAPAPRLPAEPVVDTAAADTPTSGEVSREPAIRAVALVT